MPAALVQVAIPYNTGVPEDVMVNTWSFDIADDTQDNYNEVGAFLFTFYTALDGYYSPVLDMTQAHVKLYLRSDAEPRTPRDEAIVSFGDGNLDNQPLPEEVAVCMSFRGVLASGAPPARRRGRVYLGPLSTDISVEGTNLRARVDDSFRIAVREAYQDAAAELTTTGNDHCVWSSVDGVNRVVTDLWMDDAFDTQRRRGPRATNRLTWTPTSD